MNDKFVFHGSPKVFDGEGAVPRRNIRTDGETITSDEESFHATPHKWVAFAYMYQPATIEGLAGEFYGMGVDLSSRNKEVMIFGVGSLEESLKVLYQNGGYVYQFDDGNFVYKEGLGSEEVIATRPTAPLRVERVQNPVEEMKKSGVTFRFTDVSIPKD